MAGHSQFKNIMHRKGAQDKKRAKVFSKHIREIQVAARGGLPDVEMNPALKTAVAAAKAVNMPKDNIDRAIKRGSGTGEGEAFEEIRYEGYGPGGVAIIAETLTDNRNRTVSEVRHVFTKAGGNLGTDGSVAYLFDKRGQISFGSDVDGDEIMDIAIDVGAEDVSVDEDGSIEVITMPKDFLGVKDALADKGFEPRSAEVSMVPQTLNDVDFDAGEKVLRLLDALEDLDDVTGVYTNANFPQEMGNA